MTIDSAVVIELQSTASTGRENSIMAAEIDLLGRLKFEYYNQVPMYRSSIWKRRLKDMNENLYTFGESF